MMHDEATILELVLHAVAIRRNAGNRSKALKIRCTAARAACDEALGALTWDGMIQALDKDLGTKLPKGDAQGHIELELSRKILFRHGEYISADLALWVETAVPLAVADPPPAPAEEG